MKKLYKNIAEQDIEEVRTMVKDALVKSIKRKLERAIRVHDGK